MNLLKVLIALLFFISKRTNIAFASSSSDAAVVEEIKVSFIPVFLFEVSFGECIVELDECAMCHMMVKLAFFFQ